MRTFDAYIVVGVQRKQRSPIVQVRGSISCPALAALSLTCTCTAGYTNRSAVNEVADKYKTIYMPPPPSNKSFVVRAMEASTFEGRYAGLTCVNFDPATGQKGNGFFSLVFRATDQTTGSMVAIKVMDPDHPHMPYRIAAFQREPSIIASLGSRARTLRLVTGHSTATIAIGLPGYPPLAYSLGYFVTEWLEENLDDYFYKQDTHAPLTKLRVFREILLAIMAIHQGGACHRDLKLDNLRLRRSTTGETVVAIDFGTAARLESPPIGPGFYSDPVGHHGYSPPEAFCGLSGDRELARFGDVYAAGAMLFELFNTQTFFNVRNLSSAFVGTVSAIEAECSKEALIEGKRRVFTRLASAVGSGLAAPSIRGPHHTLPDSVLTIIESLYDSMAAFDYRRRPKLEFCLRRTDSCIRYLMNAASERVARERRKRRREQMIAAAMNAEVRVRSRRAADTIIEGSENA